MSSSPDDIYTLKNMGAALTEIFSYLELGNNAGSTLIPMTTPFFISDNTSKMFVKLPMDKESSPPEPVGSSKIAFEDVGETVLATLSFPGVCTNEEIKRQKEKLMERIETVGDIGWKVSKEEDSDPEVFVLQYNAPGTLPWRRKNEIAVVMDKTDMANDDDEIVAEAEVALETDEEELEEESTEEDVEESEEESEEKPVEESGEESSEEES